MHAADCVGVVGDAEALFFDFAADAFVERMAGADILGRVVAIGQAVAQEEHRVIVVLPLRYLRT